MPPHPEDKVRVAAVPARSAVPFEKGPGLAVVFVAHEDADAGGGAAVPAGQGGGKGGGGGR